VTAAGVRVIHLPCLHKRTQVQLPILKPDGDIRVAFRSPEEVVVLPGTAAAIEIGFMLAYRAGWNLSLLPVSVNVCGAILLILIGLIAFRETLSLEKIVGVLLCIGGLVLITIRK